MTLTAGIIGMGIMGCNVAQALQSHPHVNLTCAATRSESNQNKARSLGITRVFDDYTTMLEQGKPDVVYVCTPDTAHFEPVMACLDAGIHVHVEKPMTTSVDEAARIVRKVEETGIKLQVAFNHRWLSPYHSTYRMIQQNRVGKCLMGYARKNNPISVPTSMIPWARYSSPMWFLSCHDIDLMLWWFDSFPVEVKAFGVKQVLAEKGWDTYDAMQAIVRLDSGAVITFESSWIYPENHPAMPDSFMEVIGSQGHLHMDRKMEAIEMSDSGGLKWPRSFLNAEVFGKWVGAFPSCIHSFIDCILEDTTPHVTATDGYKATLLLDAIHRSADTGKTVSIRNQV